MTGASTITNPGSVPNVIDTAADKVALADGTMPENYEFYYLPGELEVIQREEEVKRDEDFEKLPEETKEAIKEADKKVNEVLEKFTEEDQEKSGKPFVKYQLTVTKKEDLTEKDRTVPSVAAEDAVAQVKEIKKKTGKTPDESEYVDVILERTYDKNEATNREEKGKDGYDKDKWDSLDKGTDHANIILAVVIPFEVPDGMELIGVTRSCHLDDDKHEVLTAVPKVPEGEMPTKEGFYYDPETKTITLYARDFCLFGFHLMAIPPPSPDDPCPLATDCGCEAKCAFGYRLKVMIRTTSPCATIDGSCGPCGKSVIYRKPAIRRFMGMVYGVTKTSETSCGESECGCNDWSNAYVALYDYDTRTECDLDASYASLLQLNRTGCSAAERNQAEMTFTLGLSCDCAFASRMTFSGFGLCGNHNGEITLGSVQGYCAGLMPPVPTKKNPCDDPACQATKAWNLCCNTDFECPYTVAYGKWMMVWDSSIAAKVGTNLTCDQAQTGWGSAKPAKLKDDRACGQTGVLRLR